MRKSYVLGLAVLFSSLTFSEACPQKAAGSVVNFVDGKPSANKIPLDQLYARFFAYQQHLDAAAAAHEKQGKDGRWLSQHFEHELDFDEGDINIIRMAATAVSEKKVELDAKAKVIVDAIRAAWKAGTLPVGAPSPNHAALALLDRDKQENLTQQISLLNERLGPRKAEVLSAYLQGTFAGTSSVLTPKHEVHEKSTVDGGPK